MVLYLMKLIAGLIFAYGAQMEVVYARARDIIGIVD